MDEEDEETQTDAAIAAAAAAVAAAVVAASSSETPPASAAAWSAAVRPALAAVLLPFVLAVASRMIGSAPAARVGENAKQNAYAAVRRDADDAVEKAILKAGVSLRRVSRDWRRSTPDARVTLDSTDYMQEVETAATVAARIAVLGAREPVRFEAANALGATTKVWRTRRDSRVRSTHGGLEGAQAPIDGAFVSHSGATLRFPHDPLAPISETAGCRCRLSYRI